MEPVNDNPQPAGGSAGPVVGYCRACGKGLTQEQAQDYRGTLYCQEHVPSATSAPSSAIPPSGHAAASGHATPSATAAAPPPVHDAPSAGLAFVFGLIPGVGAIYNGQYAKGFVHVLIAGLLFSLAHGESGVMEPFFRMFIPVWFFYMAFEAYHTAKRRIVGEPVDEFSSIFPNSSAAVGFPVLPLLLIALGILFLLNNLDIIRIRQLMPYAGPVFLIGLGCYMLYARIKANADAAREVSHGRN